MAQSLRSRVSPEAGVVQEGPPRRPVETTRVLIAVWRACADLLPEPTPSPRLWAASPGATPRRLCEHNTRVSKRPSKPELSTLLETGTFYFAPTLSRSRNGVMGS